AARHGEAGAERRSLATVALVREHLDVVSHPAQPVRGAVGRAVVDHDDLLREGQLAQSPDHVEDRVPFVEGGNDDREVGPVGAIDVTHPSEYGGGRPPAAPAPPRYPAP